MSDLIKRLREASHDERLSTGMLYREAADALENPAHAWLMVAAEKCRELGAVWRRPEIVKSNPAAIIRAEECEGIADHFTEAASEYPPSVCVPVELSDDEIFEIYETACDSVPPTDWGKSDTHAELLAFGRAMLTAARKP